MSKFHNTIGKMFTKKSKVPDAPPSPFPGGSIVAMHGGMNVLKSDLTTPPFNPAPEDKQEVVEPPPVMKAVLGHLERQTSASYDKQEEAPPKPKKSCCAVPNDGQKASDVVYASDYTEFFYEDTDEIVPEGTAIGFDVDSDDKVELVLFDDIYWSPSNTN